MALYERQLNSKHQNLLNFKTTLIKKVNVAFDHKHQLLISKS